MLDKKIDVLLTLLLSLPISLLIWLANNLLNRLVHVNKEDDQMNELSILRAFLAVLLPLKLMIYGYKRKSVNRSGALFGLICACIMSLASFTYLVALAAFFFSSSRATKFRERQKRKFEKDFKSGGQRNWIQVICNGGMATFLSVIQIVEGLIGERPIDFQNSFTSSMLNIGVMASFACCNGDTWASELSTVVAKSDPILITSGKRVPKGTNGGITIVGLIFSTLGGLFVGIFFWLANYLLADSAAYTEAPVPQFPIIILGAISGLFGSLVDSFLGATCQYSGQTVDGFIVEHPGKGVKQISGNFKILNNHSVNLISTILTGLFIPGIALKFWSLFVPSY